MRSIVLAVLAVVCTGAGVLATPVPVVGTVFSVAAPILAVTGVVLGGMDVSRRKRAGQGGDAPLVGVVLSALAFFPAIMTAFTCGLCNALWSSTPVEVRRDIRFNVRDPRSLPGAPDVDGGTQALPPPFAPGFGKPGDAPAAPVPDAAAPTGATPAPSAPAIPPPPLPAGPRSP